MGSAAAVNHAEVEGGPARAPRNRRGRPEGGPIFSGAVTVAAAESRVIRLILPSPPGASGVVVPPPGLQRPQSAEEARETLEVLLEV